MADLINPTVRRSPIEATFEPPTALKRLGLIALSTDLTSERDFARTIHPDQAGVFTSRVAFDNPTTPENLRKMEPRLTAAAALLLPNERVDAICYSCTAASVVIGDKAIAHAIQQAKPGVPVVTPTSAAILALQAMGARRIAVLTPYLIETSRPMADYFTAKGFDVARFDCFGIDDDREMARVSHASIVEAALTLSAPDVDAIFISCTALPAFAVAATIEQQTGKPVVTSNQASIWAMTRLAGLDVDPLVNGGLFAYMLPPGGGAALREPT